MFHRELHSKGWLQRQNSYCSLVSTDYNCTDLTRLGTHPSCSHKQPGWIPLLLMVQFRAHSLPCLETTWLKAIKKSFTDTTWLQRPSDLILACLQGLAIKPISPTCAVLRLGIQLTVQRQQHGNIFHRVGNMEHFFSVTKLNTHNFAFGSKREKEKLS